MVPSPNPIKGTTIAAKTVPDATAFTNVAVSFSRSFLADLFNTLAPDRSNDFNTSFSH